MHFDLRDPRLASIGIVLGGALWGLVWLPVRGLETMGLAGVWSGLVVYLATGLLLVPVAILRRREIAQDWGGLLLTGLLTGAAFSLYTTSIVLTDVVRALLLFYLTPVWSTLLGLALLGERLTGRRAFALGLGLAGLMVILGIGEGVPWPRNTGDWLALASGLAWSLGSVRLVQGGVRSAPEQIFAFVFGSLAVSLLLLATGEPALGAPPTAATALAATPWALLTALYVLPMLALTIWPATVLSPGRAGLLLMSDVVVGVVSAAILTAEPFGLREALGTALVIGAGIVEATAPAQRQAHETP
ncbi:MAG: DMT family transporter [Paracoccaceae bacterium]